MANSILAQSQFILVSYIIKSLLFPSLLQPWGFRFAIGSLARLRKSQRKPASRRKTSARDLPRTAVAAAAPVKMLRRLRKVPRRRRKAERLETSRRRTRRSLKQKKQKSKKAKKDKEKENETAEEAAERAKKEQERKTAADAKKAHL